MKTGKKTNLFATGEKETGKKIAAGLGLSLIMSTGLMAQTSYVANSAPINGSTNAAFGYNILNYVSSGTYNVGMGQFALYNTTTGSENIAIGGSSTGYNTSGSKNSALGYASLGNNTTASHNTAVGNNVLVNNTTGSYNTAVGTQGLITNVSGTYNTALGSYANVGSSALTNAAAIGANAIVRNSNHMILGDNATHVGIGLSNDATGPTAKLEVLNAVTGSGGYYGIKGRITYGGGSNDVLVAVDGNASSVVNLFASCYGFNGTANGGQWNYGGNFNAVTTNATQGRTYGVRATASGGQLNHGGLFIATGGASGVNTYGVYAEVTNPTAGGNNYGVYATVGGNGNLGAGPNWAGWFNGDVWTTTGYYPSDRRLKKNINTISNSLNIISKLNPVDYVFDVEGNRDLNLPAVKQYGFISQEVKEILPELTKVAIHPAKFDEKGKEVSPSKEILSLNYDGFIAILAKGIQEQQQQITELKNELAALRSEKATGINQTNNSAIEGFALDQNIPNPFGNETVINYTLPSQIKDASLLVYDLSGKQIASFPLHGQGASSITLSSEKLAAGIYIYSVMADGKILDSKRMVVAQKQ